MKYKGLSNSGFHAVWMFNMSESFLRCSSLHACVSAWAESVSVDLRVFRIIAIYRHLHRLEAIQRQSMPTDVPTKF